MASASQRHLTENPLQFMSHNSTKARHSSHSPFQQSRIHFILFILSFILSLFHYFLWVIGLLCWQSTTSHSHSILFLSICFEMKKLWYFNIMEKKSKKKCHYVLRCTENILNLFITKFFCFDAYILYTIFFLANIFFCLSFMTWMFLECEPTSGILCLLKYSLPFI